MTLTGEQIKRCTGSKTLYTLKMQFESRAGVFAAAGRYRRAGWTPIELDVSAFVLKVAKPWREVMGKKGAI